MLMNFSGQIWRQGKDSWIGRMTFFFMVKYVGFTFLWIDNDMVLL